MTSVDIDAKYKCLRESVQCKEPSVHVAPLMEQLHQQLHPKDVGLAANGTRHEPPLHSILWQLQRVCLGGLCPMVGHSVRRCPDVLCKNCLSENLLQQVP